MANAQTDFRFLEEKTGQPVCGIYPTILRDKNYFVNCGGTDENGILKVSIPDKKSTSTYYLDCSYHKYNPIWKEIDFNRQDTLTIFLSKSPYFFEEPDSMFVKLCDYTSSSTGYRPQQLRSLDEFPEIIKEKTRSHIEGRVGEKYASDFFLLRGEIWDLDSINEGLKGKNRFTSKYRLCIGFKRPEKGIAIYSSEIKFDKAGNLQQGLLFPIVKNGALQENLVSFEKVKFMAKEKNFYDKGKTKIDMSYYSKPNILVWKFINRTYHDNNTFTEKTLVFNAHNGSFIKEDIYEGWWIE